MKIKAILLVGSVIPIVTACVSTPDYQPINTKDEYMTAVVGKTVQLGDGASTTHPDGTMTGKVGGEAIEGKWSWENGMFCREGTIGSEQLEHDCQKMEIAGDKLKVTRKNGEGSTSVFDLK